MKKNRHPSTPSCHVFNSKSHCELVNGKVWGIPILYTIHVGGHPTPIFYTCCHRDLCNGLCLCPKWLPFPYLVHYFWPGPIRKPIELCSKIVRHIWDRVPLCDATCAFTYLFRLTRTFWPGLILCCTNSTAPLFAAIEHTGNRLFSYKMHFEKSR
jgi:hypothetical protein